MQDNFLLYTMNLSLFQFTYGALFFSSCLSCLLFFYRTGKARIILGIESTITGVACCIYYLYIQKIKQYNETGYGLSWNGYNQLRYLDWAITTPLMLLSISYIFSKNRNTPLPIATTLQIILLDLTMLAFGYAGEMNWIEKKKASLLGFIPFVMMFSVLYKIYIRSTNHKGSISLFIFYFILWSMYGVIYLLPEGQMNNAFAVMDCISKAGISLSISYFL